VVLKPAVIQIEALERSPPPVLLLTEGALVRARDISTTLQGRGVLTVSQLRAPTLAGDVVMAISSRPRVEILISRDAARRAGIRFAAAFRMMVQER
jgi:hypothetical protein